jgi:hypothetical protein
LLKTTLGSRNDEGGFAKVAKPQTRKAQRSIHMEGIPSRDFHLFSKFPQLLPACRRNRRLDCNPAASHFFDQQIFNTTNERERTEPPTCIWQSGTVGGAAIAWS